MSLTLLDLFSGCGGMSLGFQREGFNILGGVESDSQAAQTYARNLLREEHKDVVLRHAQPRDIRDYHPSDFSREFLDSKPIPGSIDVIIAGPPCQAFARIGRAKLRDIMNHEEAHLRDHRADLYTYFLMYVDAFRPRAVVMENVPEILSFGGKNVGDEIAASLTSLGYSVGYTLLNAAHFGVPQSRVRFFLIGFRDDLEIDPLMPVPSRYSETKNNMYLFPENGNRRSPSGLQRSFFDAVGPGSFQYYMGSIEPDLSLRPAVTVRNAIGDLPAIYTSKTSGAEARSGLSSRGSYNPGRPARYASRMRRWRGYEAQGCVKNHAIRFLPRDHQIFHRMEPGDQYPEAHRIAELIFSEKLAEIERRRGRRPEAESAEYSRIRKQTVPPYSTDKFPNKWQKLDPDKPSHTLTAHLGKDSYSHIHYDSRQARVISVREAARLQSFPDGFEFPSALSHSLRLIGNAVPPLLAWRLAEVIRRQLEY